MYKKKFNSTIIEKWALYWKNILTDYKDAAIDAAKDSKEKPLKTLGILSGLSVAAVCAKYNPNEASFRDAVLKAENDVFLISASIQRKESVDHLRMIERNYNSHRIRRQNFGILSLIWVDDFSSECNVYACNCDYLAVPCIGIFDRVIDIGFMNKWWLLEKRMEDYDVNY